MSERVALALGSGGARGYAHIGAIEVLEERGFEIVSIAGTSMGALVGGLHAAGKLPEFTDWVCTLTQRDVIRLLDPSIKAPGAIRANKVLNRVGEMLGGVLIEDLPIPFTAVATDLLTRKEVWFQKGPVDMAVRASIAMPSFITPVMLNGRLLADGGLVNPVPLGPLTSSEADVVVAVSLAGESAGESSRGLVQESAEARPADEWIERFRRTSSQVLDNELLRSAIAKLGGPGGTTPEDADQAAEAFEALPRGLGMFDVMELSVEAMQSVMTRYRLAGYPPDLLISVPKDACRTLEFHKAEQMIDLGREIAREALDQWSLPGGGQVEP